MLRLQAPLSERYTAATDDELADLIGQAKEALGSRVFILGHHYQRDDVM
jgi:quinolinate synthase